MPTIPFGSPAWSRRVRIGDYDAATDKRDSATEGELPYAWHWYQEYTGMLGSGFSTARSGLVHAKKLAIARKEAAVQRAAERLVANALPSTSDDALGSWASVLKVRAAPTDGRHDIRQRAAARFLASKGPTRTNEDDSFAGILGDAFVKVWRTTGADLATPPTQTYWPGVNPGPTGYDLGGGTWLSERAHVVVEVTQPPSMTNSDFLHLVNVEFFRHADELLPAWATFNWAFGVSDGFLLDISQLDFTGITP